MQNLSFICVIFLITMVYSSNKANLKSKVRQAPATTTTTPAPATTTATPAGSFSSSGYPSSYPDQNNEGWLLTAPVGKKVKVIFTNVSIECDCTTCMDTIEYCDGSCDTECDQCKYDYVTVSILVKYSCIGKFVHNWAIFSQTYVQQSLVTFY